MCMGDLMSRKGLSDQTPSVCHLQPQAFFFIFGLSVSALWFGCFLFPCNTWESCRGEKKRCQLPNTFQLQMPGHSRTLLAFFHLKVQPSFVFPRSIIHLYEGMYENIWELCFHTLLVNYMAEISPEKEGIGHRSTSLKNESAWYDNLS